MNLLIMYLPRNKHMGVDVNFTTFHFRSYHIPFFFLPLISCSRRPLQNSQLVLFVIVPASYFVLFSTNPIHVHYDSAFSDIPLTSNITLLVHSLSIITNPITTIIITTPSTIIVTTTTTTSSTINITNNTTNTLTFKRKRLPSPPPQKSQQRVEQLRQFKLRESREDRETNWLGQERKTHRQVARRVRRKSDEDGVGKIVRSVGFRIHTEAIEEKKYGEKRSESVPSTRRGRETNEDYAEMMGQLLQSALEGSKETEEKGHSSSQDRHCHATKIKGAPS